MKKLAALYHDAHLLKQQEQLIYSGAFTPQDTLTVLLNDPHAKLVDVRTLQEVHTVGIPNIPSEQFLHIEWVHYPSQQLNPHFFEILAQQVQQDTPLLFFCRSAIRSKKAAIAAVQMGYTHVFDILEGFDGWQHLPNGIRAID